MKKIIYLATLFVSSFCYTQINIDYERSYVVNSGSPGSTSNLGYLCVFKTQQGTFYYTTQYGIGVGIITINIYNQNHLFYKTFNISSSASIKIITDKLFNGDDLIEFLYVEGIHTKLINENGVLLYTWSNRMDPKIFKDDNNNYKLIVYNKTGTYPITTTSDIYGLAGTLSVDQQDLYLDKFFRGYPNPAESTIIFSNGKYLLGDTKLEIFDSNGRKIFEKEVLSGEKEIIFDVSSYSSGTYIYKINGEAHQFIKK